jgi:polar amino acid transport system permease protein
MLTQRGFSALLTYGTALVLYFLVGWALAALGRYAERRLTGRSRASHPAASPLPAG